MGKSELPYIWAWGCDSGEMWRQANIVGDPDPRWQWLTIDPGLVNLRKGLFLRITRNGREVAKAEIEKMNKGKALAWILKGTMHPEDSPSLGDKVEIIA